MTLKNCMSNLFFAVEKSTIFSLEKCQYEKWCIFLWGKGKTSQVPDLNLRFPQAKISFFKLIPISLHSSSIHRNGWVFFAFMTLYGSFLSSHFHFPLIWENWRQICPQGSLAKLRHWVWTEYGSIQSVLDKIFNVLDWTWIVGCRESSVKNWTCFMLKLVDCYIQVRI